MHNEMDDHKEAQSNPRGSHKPGTYHSGIKERKGKVFTTKALDQMRADLDVSVEDFARLLGLSFMTVYNWEKSDGSIEVSDLQGRILTVLNHLCIHNPDLLWADDVRGAVTKQGGLYGLHKLLTHYYRSLAQQQASRKAKTAAVPANA